MLNSQLKLSFVGTKPEKPEDILAIVNHEIELVFDPYMEKVAGERMIGHEKVLLRTYLMAKVLARLDDSSAKVSNT